MELSSVCSCSWKCACLKIIKNANNVHPTSFPGYLAELWWRSMHGTTPFNDFVAGETVSRALIDGTHIRLKALYNGTIFTFYKRHVFNLCFGVRVP